MSALTQKRTFSYSFDHLRWATTSIRISLPSFYSVRRLLCAPLRRRAQPAASLYHRGAPPRAIEEDGRIFPVAQHPAAISQILIIDTISFFLRDVVGEPLGAG